METLNPNNDAENRHHVGGRKRSSRRSSILKTAKSPMKMALEDIDLNSLGNGKEKRDDKSNRRSSGRRVSFAQTYQVKEFCKDEEWNAIWEKENSMTSDQTEQPDLSPSEYRQPTDTIKGLESLLKGDIQNLQDGDEPSMDFTFCGNIIDQSGRQAFQPLEGYIQGQEHHYEDEMNALELTCHGQGLINQDDRAKTDVFQSQYQSTGSRKESYTRSEIPGYAQDSQYYQQMETKVGKARDICSNKENEGMDFTLCLGPDRYDVMSSQRTHGKDRMFEQTSGDMNFHSMDLTCHGQGLVSHQNTSTKVNPSSFLQSLGSLRSSQPKESSHQSVLAHHQQKDKMVEKPNARSFLARLSESGVGMPKELDPNMSVVGPTESSDARSIVNPVTVSELPDITEPDEDMEMTACMDLAQTDMKTAIQSNATVQDGMDMTACLPPASRLQDNLSAVSEAQMDMTACVPPAPRLQDNLSAVSEAQMDMTTCVPPVLRLHDNPSAVSEAQKDMTKCVPPAPRLQDNLSAVSEAQMDMTTCVPPAPRLQENPLAMSEAQMDMTTCVPPAPRLQENPLAVSEAQMDMTTCVPSAPRLQNNPSAVSEAQMDMTTCVPPASRLQGNPSAVQSEAQMDMTTCVPPAPRLQENPLAVSEAQMDMTTCVPPAPRLQNNPSAVSEAQMDMTTFSPSAPRLQSNPSAVSEVQMDMTCVPPAAPFLTVGTAGDHSINKGREGKQEGLVTMMAHGKGQQKAQDEIHVSASPENDSSLVFQTDSRKRQNSSSIDSTIQSEVATVKKKQLAINPQDHPQSTSEISSYTGPVSTVNSNVGSSIQSWLNRSMPMLDRKKPQPTFVKSLPTLSRSLLEFDGSGNKTIPHATFAPVSNVPISKFCTQPATKRKMIQIDQQEISVSQDEQTSASSSAVTQKDNSPEDSSTPDNDIGTEQSCDQGIPQYDDEVDDKISFKDPPMTRTEEQSEITGLMEEPTLELDFTDQSAISVSLSTMNPTSHQESKDKGEIPKPSDDSTVTNTEHFMEQKTSNLSTIREEHDIDGSKLVDHRLPTGKQETSVKQKNMTVAELLSRANISFHFIEQVSRRSTAFIKKPEKPEEEKEFIQLSLFKKPLAISFNDVCTNIQKEVAKLKETMDRQETELNESNASILQHVDDSKMTELEVKLKELKNICKKCAYRKWVRRTGTMKKKLALTLKENCELLSNDVHNVNETLLVTSDCLKVIDGIDKEIDDGMESFRKSIEETEMENEELDKVEAVLKEKKMNLETREGELKEMEDQRSSFATTKETLSSEKETLEREQLSLEEMLSKLKNKPSPRESNESLSEKYKWLEGCLEWELTEWNQNHAKFLFLHDTLELRVDFDQSDVAQSCNTKADKKIQTISVSSQLADDSHLSARFVHSLVVNGLNQEHSHISNTNPRSLPKVLEHVSGLVLAARSLGSELFEVNFQHILTVNGNSICVEFSSVQAFKKFIVQFTIDICKYPDEVKITIIPKIGTCCALEIQDALTSVPTGPKYMTRLVETARRFLDEK